MPADDSKEEGSKPALPKVLERQKSLDRFYMPAMPPLGMCSWIKRHITRLMKRSKRSR